MIESIAKQAIWIKCYFPNAIITGEYELCYVMGILSKEIGLEYKENFPSITEEFKYVIEGTKNYNGENQTVKHLIDIINEYTIKEVELDKQMYSLYNQGYQEAIPIK